MNFAYNFNLNLTRLKDILLFPHAQQGYIDGNRVWRKDKKALKDVFFNKDGVPVCKIEYNEKGIIFYENN